MLLIETGNYVFSYFDSTIRVIGVVMNLARSCQRRGSKFAHDFWNENGWLVAIESVLSAYEQSAEATIV